MQHIKNIIFDLGGVFLNIDFKKTEKAFIDLGIIDFPEYYTQHHASDLFELLETGKLTPEAFYAAFRNETKSNLSDAQIKEAWNALLLDFPKTHIDWLTEKAQQYNVFLFSNTNQIHYDAFSAYFTEHTGHKDFNALFKKAYYSHQMGLRKPYEEAFRFILEEQKLEPSSTLFIDDTIKNIEGANKVGLNTIHLIAPLTVLDLPL